ncbi:hypothetical protein FRB95_007812 [Tulasnella sp. JGI-2019a]|nr:hypothetical protein FRB95_007812 [Tulasnella sp. JGI-2019a]
MWARILATAYLAFDFLFLGISEPDRAGLKRTVVSERFGATLRITENSGICETIPGVHTVSGYVDTGNNQNYWFWFFSARQNTNAPKIPFVVWFNGENGPCKVNSDKKTTTLNTHSWNEVANVLYVDQPIGADFSHGTETTMTSDGAALLIWQMLQAFFEAFPIYEGRELIFATEGYGGHYGPAFASFFDTQTRSSGVAPSRVKSSPSAR